MAGEEACPYRLTRPLRRGSLISVFEAVDAQGTAVVVKQMNPSPADPIGVKRFEREKKLSAMANHPGLARVHGNGRDWIAFERLALSAPGRRPPASLEGARMLLARLAEALAYLHSRGVVHRDVKPANIMFRAEQPVLIDLGVAGLTADDPLDRELVGSPAWMAPEQLSGARPAPPADIWSLCAVGVSLLAGSPLFSGSADEVLALRRAEPRAFRFPDEVADDPLLSALLEAGLGPADGRPSAAEIAAELLPLCDRATSG